MKEIYSMVEAAELFYWHVRKNYRKNGDAAGHYRVSRSYLSSAMNGHKPLNELMLEDIGLEKMKGYKKKGSVVGWCCAQRGARLQVLYECLNGEREYNISEFKEWFDDDGVPK